MVYKNVASIKTNEFLIKEETPNIKELINNAIKENVKIESIEETKLMEKVVDTIKCTPNDIADTIICYEDNNNIYQLCHLSTEKDNNGISSYLSYENNTLKGNTLLIKTRITETGTCVLDSIEEKDVYNLIYKKIIIGGVKLDVNGTMNEFTYFMNPGYYFKDKDKYNILEFNFIGFNIFMVMEKVPENNTCNKYATRLYGDVKINGDVYIFQKNTENVYSHINKNTLEKLLDLSWGNLDNRNLLETEKKSDKKKDGLLIAMNKYIVLENRHKKYKKTCNYCNSEIKITYICTGCYRCRYASNECRKKDWNKHKHECRYKTKGTYNNFVKQETSIIKNE